MAIFYITALTFAVLVIPFQFGIVWLSLGWLIEGTMLIIYGERNRFKWLEKAGWGIFALCAGAFFCLEYLPAVSQMGTVRYFDLKYLAVVTGMILITLNYQTALAAHRISWLDSRREFVTVFKYLTVGYTCLYLLQTGHRLFLKWVPDGSFFHFYYLLMYMVIFIGYGYLISHFKLIIDRAVRGFAIVLYLAADLICIGLNCFLPTLNPNAVISQQYLAMAVLIAFNIFMFLNIRDLLVKLIRGRKLNLEYYPMLLGLFLLGNITGFIITQFHLSPFNLLFSCIYLLMALSFIVYGFAKKFRYIRQLGLGLTLFAIGKLFIFDLSFLNKLHKILAYFGFGLTLLVISFIYQRVKNSLEGSDVTKNV
jgi:hypothetical protein